MRRDTPEFEAFQDKFGREAEAQGWVLVLTDGAERLELLTSRHNDLFNDDVDAWAHILARAETDALCAAAAALALISDGYRNEISHKVRQVFGSPSERGLSIRSGAAKTAALL